MELLFNIIYIIGGFFYGFLSGFLLKHGLLNDIKTYEKPIVLNDTILKEYQDNVNYFNSFNKLDELKIKEEYNKKYIIQTLKINQ